MSRVRTCFRSSAAASKEATVASSAFLVGSFGLAAFFFLSFLGGMVVGVSCV